MTTDKSYYVKRVLDSDDIEDLLCEYRERDREVSLVYNGEDGGVKSKARTSTKVKINSDVYPDISSKINGLVTFYGRDPAFYSPHEMDLLHYGVGGKFLKHTDRVYNGRPPRLYTTVTLLRRSEDLVGGDFMINDEKVPLNVGDTVILKSDVEHEVKEVVSGERYSMVIWIYAK